MPLRNTLLLEVTFKRTQRSVYRPLAFHVSVILSSQDFSAVFSTHQQAGFQDRLKAIADSEHQFVGLQKFTHGFIELTAKLTRKNDSRAQVVSVTESARHAQNLVLAQQIRIFQQAEQVDSVGRRTRQFKRVSGLGITIGPWGSQNTNSRRCHVRLH